MEHTSMRRKKKPAHILDFFLFVDPIDSICLNCANDILGLQDKIKQKHYFHFIPYHNLQTIDNYLKRHQLSTCDIALRNQIYQAAYTISLTYKAANFQGKKKARDFFKNLAPYTKTFHHEISDADIIAVAQASGLDIDMLLEDRASEAAKILYLKDQSIANQFNIRKTPSLIIFDSCSTNGILLEDDISIEHIEYILHQNQTDMAQAK